MNTSISLALIGLKAILSLIAEIKGQNGLTDDEILTQAENVTAGNAQELAKLKSALTAAVVVGKK